MNKRYLEAVNQSLELNHKQNEQCKKTLFLIRENLSLEIKLLQKEVADIDKKLDKLKEVEERYQKVVNNNDVNVVANDNSTINQAIKTTEKIEQPMTIHSVENLNIGK